MNSNSDTEPSAIPSGDILADTEPVPVDGIAGRYQLEISEAWRIMFAFGGVTMAAAIRAAEAEVARSGAPGLRPISCDATFCQAIPCGPVAVQVEVLRSGRSGAQAIARLWALDPERPDPSGPVGNDLVVTLVMGVDKDSPLSFVGAVAPDVPDPLECPGRKSIGDNPYARIPYHRQTDFRLAFGNLPGSTIVAPGEPRTASWFRFNNTPRLPGGNWEPSAVAVPGDILGPAVHTAVGSEQGFFFVISLQIGLVWVAQPCSEWLLQHTRAHVAANGYASGSAEIFDEERNLVAIASQTALLRVME